MANFTGKNICATFSSILNVGACEDNNCVLPDPNTTRIVVTDGVGNNSSVCLARDGGGMSVNGTLDMTGHIVVDSTCGCSVCTPILCQTTAAGCVDVKGDFFVDKGASTEFSINNSTGGSSAGLVYAKGQLCVGQGHANGDTTCNTFYNHGTICSLGTIRGAGDIVAFSSSDKRLKDDINKIESSKNIIDGINGYTFTWKEGAEQEGKSLGVIAQEVKEVLPDIVHERANGMLAVDYIKLIPVLVEEVKRLSKEVDELKNA